ncbi:acyltransferase family protein [Pseudomonas sp. MAG733B]|uniref:acyltransferase family protein n=1 Tax=Pseudomonas sp. MAG733B TaxID=3122079 RepID=UPI0030D53CDA
MDSLSKSKPVTHPVKLAYRPDIDGLRAVAILSVIIFHAFPARFQGGFVGVDIFFVISGFLISSIIFKGLHRGDFSFTEFYAHRIKRIYPALIVVLVACYIFGWISLLPDEFQQLGKHIAAGAGFVQNVILLNEVGYFNVDAELKPLLHLWSLAIEEQFYLVYPVLAFFVWRAGLNLLTIVILLSLVSIGLNVDGVSRDPISTFFMPQTRFWELLAGSILAYIQLYKKNQLTRFLQNLLFHPVLFRHPPQSDQRGAVLNNLYSIFGLFFLIAAFFLIDKSKLFPGWWAILPVSGAFLLILSGPDAWVNRVVLSNRLMVFIGVISYPLYLWHWPILSFARIVESEIPSREIRVGAVLLSVLLAWLTYILIEKPIRLGRKSWMKTAVLSISMVVVGLVGYSTFLKEGLPFRVERFAKISKAAGEWEYPGRLVNEKFSGINYYAQYSNKKSLTLFVGDSNIEQYYPRVRALIEDDAIDANGAIFKTGGGCLAIPDVEYDLQHKHCSALMQEAFRLAQERPDISTVVIGSLWNAYLTNGTFMAARFGVGSSEYVEALNKLGLYIKNLRLLNKRVYVVLNIPAGNKLDPKYMVQRDLMSFPSVLSIRDSSVRRDDLDQLYGQVQSDLARVAKTSGASTINPMDFLCADNCPGVDAQGEPMYKDADHLRPRFVRQNANFIDEALR